jgi:hypothetical protein
MAYEDEVYYLQNSRSGTTDGLLLIKPTDMKENRQVPVHVVIAADISGSMDETVEHDSDGNPVSRHKVCRNIITDIARTMAECSIKGDRVSAYGFSNRINSWAMSMPVVDFAADMETLLPMMPTFSGTDIGLSLQHFPVPVVQEKGVQRVVLIHITDGLANNGITSESDLATAQQHTNKIITTHTGMEPFIIAIAISSGSCFTLSQQIAQTAGDRGFAKRVLDSALGEIAGDIGGLLKTTLSGFEVECQFSADSNRRLFVARDGTSAIPMKMCPLNIVGWSAATLIDCVCCSPILTLFDDNKVRDFFERYGLKAELDIDLAVVPSVFLGTVVKKMARVEEIRQCLQQAKELPVVETLFRMSSQSSQEATDTSAQFEKWHKRRYTAKRVRDEQ